LLQSLIGQRGLMHFYLLLLLLLHSDSAGAGSGGWRRGWGCLPCAIWPWRGWWRGGCCCCCWCGVKVHGTDITCCITIQLASLHHRRGRRRWWRRRGVHCSTTHLLH
jgi:hypothetical protein